MSIALGLIGVLGRRASLMMLPAPTVVVVSSLTRLVSEFNWFCELLRRLSRLLRSELPDLVTASRVLIAVSEAVSCLILAFSEATCWSRPAWAVCWRLRRYASANACEPAWASAGVGASNVDDQHRGVGRHLDRDVLGQVDG